MARDEANSLPKGEEWNKLYRIYIPEVAVEVLGCITWPINQELDDLNEDGFGKFKNPNLPAIKILDAMRFTKSVDEASAEPTRVDIGVVRITFEGLVLPDSVNVCGLLVPVREFKRRQMFCDICLSYNHTKTHCVNKPRPTTSAVQCVQCNSAEHVSGSKDCPRRKILEKRDNDKAKFTRKKTYAEMLRQLDPTAIMPGEGNGNATEPRNEEKPTTKSPFESRLWKRGVSNSQKA